VGRVDPRMRCDGVVSCLICRYTAHAVALLNGSAKGTSVRLRSHEYHKVGIPGKIEPSERHTTVERNVSRYNCHFYSTKDTTVTTALKMTRTSTT
jgi:hypothetical protein